MAAKKTAQKPSSKTQSAPGSKKSAPAAKAAPAKSAPAAKAAPAKSAPAAKAAKSALTKAIKGPPPKSAPEPKAGKSAPAKSPPPKSAPATKPVKARPPESTDKEESKSARTQSSFTETVKRAATKVAQAAAAAALKVLDPDSGRAAPSFELSDQAGKLVSSDSLAGKPYLLYFYPKDDTPGCTKEACDIRDNFARFGKQGLRVLGVSPDSTQSHTKFIQKYGLPFTLLSDPDKSLANAYGVWAEKSNYGKKYMGIVRSSFLVGADGVIKKAYRGVKVDGHVDAVLQDAKAML